MAGLGWIFWAKLGSALLMGVGATANMIFTSMDVVDKSEKFQEKLKEKKEKEKEKSEDMED